MQSSRRVYPYHIVLIARLWNMHIVYSNYPALSSETQYFMRRTTWLQFEVAGHEKLNCSVNTINDLTKVRECQTDAIFAQF